MTYAPIRLISMIVSVRGTNGSGKSTVVRGLMDLGTARPIYGLLGASKPEAYELSLDKIEQFVYVIGPYQVPTGGCDQIHPYETIIALIEKYMKRGHVLFEGVIVGSVWGRVGVILDSIGKDSIIVILTTSLEECISRVQVRRDSKGIVKLLNPKNLEFKYYAIAKMRENRLKEDVVRIIDTPSEGGVDVIYGLLMEA